MGVLFIIFVTDLPWGPQVIFLMPLRKLLHRGLSQHPFLPPPRLSLALPYSQLGSSPTLGVIQGPPLCHVANLPGQGWILPSKLSLSLF